MRQKKVKQLRKQFRKIGVDKKIVLKHKDKPDETINNWRRFKNDKKS